MTWLSYSQGSSWRLILVLAIVPYLAAAQSALADTANGHVQGVVFVIGSDGARSVVAGAHVRLEGCSQLVETSTDQQGNFSFNSVAPAIYEIRANASGLSGSAEVKVSAGADMDIQVQMTTEVIRESVTVQATATSAIATDASGETVLTRPTVLNAPNKYDRVDNLLPLVPGVVRGPDGLINMKGARSSQGGALLNSASVTDPATGTPAMSLPIDVVESVKVVPNPYDAEYGRLTGAVSSIETTTSNFDALHFTVQNLFVRPRKRSGDFVGIESATPRMTVTGPIVKKKVAFTQSVEYRYIRAPVSSLPQLQRDTKLEGVNSFTQGDVNLTERQSLTATFALYPQKLNYLGLNTFNPQPSTPDLHQRGYMASLQHRYVTGSASMLLSQFSYKRFDVDVTANSADPYQLLIETTAGGTFNRQNRDTYRTEWQETYQFGTRYLFGSHQIKVGIDYAYSNYDGRVDLMPVTIIGVSNLPIEQITFGPAARFHITQNQIAWFVADNWAPFRRLTVDLGVRADRDSTTDQTTVAPRAGLALMLTQDAKTLLKGGFGLFYDQVPLNIASFPFLPDRTIDTLASGLPLWESNMYVNTVTRRLENPRSVGWNLEVDRQITSALVFRVGFQQRNSSRDFRLTPEADQGALALSNDGRSFYREFQFAGTYKTRRGTLNGSYVRSRAFGNLNDFNQFFGNNATPVIQPDQFGRLPFDAPNRFLFWGQFNAPFKLLVAPTFDLHTGFPYSIVDQYHDFVGPRASQRFGRVNSFDMQVTRPVKLPFPHKDIKARVGFSVFNLFNHFNPRDVQGDVDSDRYGAFFNGVGRTFRGKFILEF